MDLFIDLLFADYAKYGHNAILYSLLEFVKPQSYLFLFFIKIYVLFEPRSGLLAHILILMRGKVRYFLRQILH